MASLKSIQTTSQTIIEGYWTEERAISRHKVAVLVEGDDDKELLEAVLSSRMKTWATSVHVIAAGGRNKVLKRLQKLSADGDGTIQFPDGYGLVDRDTWSDAEVAAQRKALDERLYVTAGWCMESIFLDPVWLNAQFPDAAKQLAAERERWVRAGALWWVLQRTRDAQQVWQEKLPWNYGKPLERVDYSSGAAVGAALKQRIPDAVRRDASFDLEAIGERYQSRCEEILGLTESEQWRLGVHGKAAFKELLLPTLQQGGTPQPDNWLVELAKQLKRPLPPPIDELVGLLRI